MNGHEGWFHPGLSLGTLLPGHGLRWTQGWEDPRGQLLPCWAVVVLQPHGVLIPHGTTLCSTGHPLLQRAGQGDDRSGGAELGYSPWTQLQSHDSPGSQE